MCCQNSTWKQPQNGGPGGEVHHYDPLYLMCATLEYLLVEVQIYTLLLIRDSNIKLFFKNADSEQGAMWHVSQEHLEN